MSLELEFVHLGDLGRVSVTCVPNDDPDSVGKGAEARGFPMCTATIDFPGRGYRSMVGWIQLVRSTDNESSGAAFEIDPARFFGFSWGFRIDSRGTITLARLWRLSAREWLGHVPYLERTYPAWEFPAPTGPFAAT